MSSESLQIMGVSAWFSGRSQAISSMHFALPNPGRPCTAIGCAVRIRFRSRRGKMWAFRIPLRTEKNVREFIKLNFVRFRSRRGKMWVFRISFRTEKKEAKLAHPTWHPPNPPPPPPPTSRPQCRDFLYTFRPKGWWEKGGGHRALRKNPFFSFPNTGSPWFRGPLCQNLDCFTTVSLCTYYTL